MDFLKNEFRKRFKDQKLPNDQFETEELWNDLSNHLDKESAQGKYSAYASKGIILLLVGFGLVGIFQLLPPNATNLKFFSESTINLSNDLDKSNTSTSSSNLTQSTMTSHITEQPKLPNLNNKHKNEDDYNGVKQNLNTIEIKPIKPNNNNNNNNNQQQQQQQPFIRLS